MKNKPEWYWTWVRVQDGEIVELQEMYPPDDMRKPELYDGVPARGGGIWIWVGLSYSRMHGAVFYTSPQEYRDAYAASK